MTLWMLLDRALDRLPGWPTERQWVTIGTYGLIVLLLRMAQVDHSLWSVEVYKVIIQAVVLTGALNMILAFHFAANKSDEDKTANTGKALDAMKAVAENAGGGADATKAAQDVADAAADKAEQIKGEAV